MSLRLKQVLAVLVGILVAAVMLVLGLWQMSRFQLSMQDIAAERRAMAPVELTEHIGADGTIDDIYGRIVTAQGHYLPEYEEVVGTGSPRVVTAFQMDDGRHVAVVRGITDGSPPPPPAGGTEIAGVLTASDHDDPEAPSGSVRLQKLAQTWPSPLVSGYVTLTDAQAGAHGLRPAEAVLPEGQGTAMHQGYALQWWVFAVAAIAFSVFIARNFRVQEEKRAERIARRRAAAARMAEGVRQDVD